MAIVLGLTGPARSGKDTAANYLINEHGFKPVSFAEPLKRAMSEILGESVEYIEAHKEEEVSWLPGVTRRQMLQELGTECGRTLWHPQIWVIRGIRRVKAHLTHGHNVVVTDTRFPNEAQAIRDLGGSMVHIRRPGGPTVRAHVSEAGVPFGFGDHVLMNKGGIADFYERIEACISTGAFRHVA